MQTKQDASTNPYRDLAKWARAIRNRQLQDLPLDDRADLKAAWSPILARLAVYQKHMTLTNQRARERRAGPVLSVEEARRIKGLKAWVDGGCRLEGWDLLVSSELAPRGLVPGGWVKETVCRIRTTLNTRDLRSNENAI